MLILLQPGIQPLGQFDLDDDHVSLVKGGEVASFMALDLSDGYAADVARPGPQVQLTLSCAGDGYGHPVWGLVDEGSSAGLGQRGYGTMFGQVIGGTVGQGTGIGAMSSSGAVVVGPSTVFGSGKVTLWTKPGLYGVTANGWATEGDFVAASYTVNTKIYGHDDSDAALVGKLTCDTDVTVDGDDFEGSGSFCEHVAYSIGKTTDTSFVSTPPYYASASTGTAATIEFCALYLVGCA
jgi:hypothetical protein